MAAADLCALYLDNHLRMWIGRRQEVSCACPVYVLSRSPDLAVTGWMSRARKEKLELEAAATH